MYLLSQPLLTEGPIDRGSFFLGVLSLRVLCLEGPFVFRVLWPGSFSPRVLLFEGPLSQGSFDQGPLGLGPFVKGPLTRVLLPQIHFFDPNMDLILPIMS